MGTVDEQKGKWISVDDLVKAGLMDKAGTGTTPVGERLIVAMWIESARADMRHRFQISDAEMARMDLRFSESASANARAIAELRTEIAELRARKCACGDG